MREIEDKKRNVLFRRWRRIDSPEITCICRNRFSFPSVDAAVVVAAVDVPVTAAFEEGGDIEIEAIDLRYQAVAVAVALAGEPDYLVYSNCSCTVPAFLASRQCLLDAFCISRTRHQRWR